MEELMELEGEFRVEDSDLEAFGEEKSRESEVVATCGFYNRGTDSV
ncbi:MAG: hypothetical protein RMI74_08310 [Thermodesulfobacterium sp.]|nr:hypothetical protein [Thermodesulfobacterium sp.]